MATGHQLKAPPVFKEEDDYMSWKNDIEVWQMFTDIDQKKRGPAVYLSLTGKAREAVRDIKPAELGGNDGVEKILEKLDGLFLKDHSTRAYVAFKEFHEFKRSAGENFADFMIKFEQLYSKLVKYEMELPDAVQAYFLLSAANMSEDNEKLARTTCTKLDYTHMKNTLMKIFGDPSGTDEHNSGVLAVKEECFYGKNRSNKTYKKYKFEVGDKGDKERKIFQSKDRYDQNPTDREGNVLRCFECDSTRHLASKCPHRSSRRKTNESNEVHITLFASAPDERQFCLIGESFGKGVLDSGCTKTVSGETWMNEYLNTLPKDKLESVEVANSNSTYRFGDGKETKAVKTIKTPVIIGNKNYVMEVDVVDNEIPLLISKKSMKRMGMTLNFKNDTANVGEKDIPLYCTKSGHYSIPLTSWCIDTKDPNNHIVLHMKHLQGLSKEEKMKKAGKLHRQFAHASKEKLVKLIKESKDFCDKEFIDCVKECCIKCEICKKYKRPYRRPVVGLPLASEFNEVVCMDLKEYIHNKIWILHLIDSASRYSAACLVKTKKKDVIIKEIYRIWIAYFGPPQLFISDNGGEFSNDVMTEMNEKLGVETRTTAGESPFSNGIVERHNKILFEAMMKTIEDVKCEPEIALAWSVSAKNSLQNHGGYSPNQLVFGHNVSFPSLLTDRIPALEPTTSSDIIRKNMNALYSARKNFIAAENSEKIRRALRHQIRTYADEIYENGDKIYFKRKSFKGWKGPGIVIGKDGQTVVVKYGGQIFRVHPSQLMKTEDERLSSEGNKIKENIKGERRMFKEKKDNIRKTSWKLPDIDFDNEEEIEDKEETERTDSESTDSESATSMSEIERFTDEEMSEIERFTDEEMEENIIRDNHQKEKNNRLENGAVQFEENVDEVVKKMTRLSVDEGLDICSDDYDLKRRSRPRPNTCISFELDGKHSKAKVLSSQPKRSGVNKSWVNILIEGQEKPSSVNWDKVTKWKEIESKENVVYLSTAAEMEQAIVDAKEREIQKLKENDTFEEVKYCGQSVVSSRWVITEKWKEQQKIVKARLVARGFEEDSSQFRTDSPTCSRQSYRLVQIIAVSNSWKIHSLDIASAFLQGDPLKRDVFLKPPSDVCEKNYVWKLKRCIYGLNDAPRAWYSKLRSEIIKLGGKVSRYDPALYMWYNMNQLSGILVTHVDDFLYCGTDQFLENVIAKQKKIFKISTQASTSFKYLGLNVIQDEETMEITIDQHDYIEQLNPAQIDRNESNERKLNKEEKTMLRSISGQIAWVTSQTRPDMAFESCQIANFGKSPDMKMLKEANKALRKLKSKKVRLKIPNVGDLAKVEILCFTDATHASLKCGSSQGAYIICLFGNDKVVPVVWQSKKISRVTKSPLASETLALSEGADAGYLLATQIKEIFLLENLPQIRCVTDNKSLFETMQTSNLIKDLRLRVDIARLREMEEKGEISVSWIDGKNQIADCMTKSGASSNKLLDVLESSSIQSM